MRSVSQGMIAAECLIALWILVAPGRVPAAAPDSPAAAPDSSGAPPGAERQAGAGLKEGWKKTVPIPHPALGQGDRYVVWVEDGWLRARREKATGDTDWEVVLARASDPTPPAVEAPKGSVRFEVSYHGGRYFVREDAFLLRCLRESKPKAAPWPSLAVRQADPKSEKASAGKADQPPAVREWKSREWIMVASGPADRPDCVLRLCPADAEVEKSGGWGAAALAHPSTVREVFYKDCRVMDDGELLVANRLLDRASGPIVGDPAPPFATKTLDGKPLKLADFKGKYVLLDFWATWCGPCVEEMPRLQELHGKFAGDGRLVILGLSLDGSAEAPAKFVADKKIPWPQGHAGNADESQIAKDYGVGSIPAIFLIGPDGTVLAKGLRGKELEAAVDKALNGR